jgi:hypothetical protein
VIKLCNGKDFMGRKMVVDRAVSQLPKESNSNVMLKTKDEPGEYVALKEKKFECVQESSRVETRSARLQLYK